MRGGDRRAAAIERAEAPISIEKRLGVGFDARPGEPPGGMTLQPHPRRDGRCVTLGHAEHAGCRHRKQIEIVRGFDHRLPRPGRRFRQRNLATCHAPRMADDRQQQQRAVMQIGLGEGGTRHGLGTGEHKCGNFRPSRDRNVRRNRMKLPLPRIGRRLRPLRCRRHHMDDPVAPRFQLMQDLRQRAGRFWPGCRAAAGSLCPWPRYG